MPKDTMGFAASSIRWKALLLLLWASVVVDATASVADIPKKKHNNNNDDSLKASDNKNNNAASESNQTCEASSTEDGTCQVPDETTSNGNDKENLGECGLYLAKSSIPNAGWGMYSGFALDEGDVIPPVDVVVPTIDHEAHMNMLKHYKRLARTVGNYIDDVVFSGDKRKFSPSFKNASLQIPVTPKWLMVQYYWDASITHNYYDAEHIDSVVPGLGMLANSHPGMILAENIGPGRPKLLGGRGNPARTPYQDQSFIAYHDIPAHHEIFVEYGDDWFEDRFDEKFGLSDDYYTGNKLVEKWQREFLDKYYFNNKSKLSKNQELWQNLSQLVMDIIEPLGPRLHSVLSPIQLVPSDNATDRNWERFKANENPTAYASVPNAPQTQEWLQENGLCLDHITVRNSTVAPGERGAFASRPLKKGTVVAPAPVVHMSRDHLTMLLMDEHDPDMVLWKGYQLLLNYVYGHTESSLLFFPYSPAVNLINHYGGLDANAKNRKPNVKLQWSSKMPHPEWLESFTPDQIVAEAFKAGMVMEIVALEDIPEGAEILMDYGEAWQSAYEEHKVTTPPVPDLPEVEWNAQKLLTINDAESYPSFVQTVCWIHDFQKPHSVYDRAQDQGQDVPQDWIKWQEVSSVQYLSETMTCEIVGRQAGGAFYNVILREHVELEDDGEIEVEVKITNIPRRAITVVPTTYTNAELRRDAFRHEIQLPEEMVPEHWRDLKENAEEPEEQCSLYMAESSIPNAGLGLYRGYATPLAADATNELDNFCEDMVIQVEDFALNQVLRNRMLGKDPDLGMDNWILSQYAWKGSEVKGANLEAEHVLSLVPGCGMMANSHPSLYNSHPLPPLRQPLATSDPSLGASTHYHGGRFVEQYLKQGNKKIRTMQQGTEIFAKYGDQWFLDRESIIGAHPLRDDYTAMNKVIRKLIKLKQTHGEEAVGLLLKLLWNTVEVFHLDRIAKILPKTVEELQQVLDKGGTAEYSLPDRVRSLEWLEEHGTCADNIQAGESTIDMAGKGAFAKRRIAQGQVIAPLPMIHVHRDHMGIYNSEDIFDPEQSVFHENDQLLKNYCYGHAESSLLLFPYSPVVNYINHAPMACENDEGLVANAKLQWSSRFNNIEWLQKSPEELLRNHTHAGLAMEIVATRDISHGEEILLDYGEAWQAAWLSHVEKWDIGDGYEYEAPYNDWLEWVPTSDEAREGERGGYQYQFQRDDKYLGCHVKIPDLPSAPVDEEADDLPEFQWTMVDGMFRTTRNVFPCEIIKRTISNADLPEDILWAMIRKESVSPLTDLYDAIISEDVGEDEIPRRFISRGMPRRAIEIFDTEYAAPQFHREAFRHEIGIPDSIFPEAWKDLKKKA